MTSINLTSEDVRAMRSATDLCFDHNSEGTRIRAIRRFHGTQSHQPEQTYVIRVEGNRVQDYTPRSGSPENYDCFSMAMNSQYMDRVRTFVYLAKKGDRLGFVWTRGNSSPVTVEAGIVIDHLDVQIVKPNNSVLTLRLDTFTGLDNSARMVKPRNG